MNNHRLIYLFTLFIPLILSIACNNKASNDKSAINPLDSITHNQPVDYEKRPIKTYEIKIVKDFLYDKYTLDDNYPYNKNSKRCFQWEKIKEKLAYLHTEEIDKTSWGYLENYKFKNGHAPLVHNYKRNAYDNIVDSFGTERYQGIPLYELNDSLTPIRYGLDGSLVKIKEVGDRFAQIEGVSIEGMWNVPKKYLVSIGDSILFRHVVLVDVKNQNIVTLEQAGRVWLVRSMNPATTGRYKPPYAYPTPTGMFLLIEKKFKMFYYVDGTTDIAGYAPYANRFTRGAHIHGIPTNHPEAPIIEYSASLGTTPRSHMCVRNATSHAKFLYDWAPLKRTVVFVID